MASMFIEEFQYRPVTVRLQTHSVAARQVEAVTYLVSDDAERISRLSELFLSRGIAVRSLCADAELVAAECARHARFEQAACLVLDLDYPALTGLDVQRMLAGSPVPPILFVAGSGDALSVVRALKQGAVDVLDEPFEEGRLMAAVQLAFALDRKNRMARAEQLALLSCWKSLTPREAEVFHYTTAGLLNKQASAELGIAENTYQVHRGRVMRKMKANSLAELVRMSARLELIPPKMQPERLASPQRSVPVSLPTRYPATPRPWSVAAEAS